MKYFFPHVTALCAVFLMMCCIPFAHADVPVLMYHRVNADLPPSATVVSPVVFDQHMRILRNAGYKTTTVGELGKRISEKKLKNEKLVVITFDDGWRDSLAAVDIMKRYGFSGTYYVMSNTFNNPVYMSMEDVKTLAKSDNEVGAHSHTHFMDYTSDLSKIPLTVMVGEALLSRAIIEDVINKPVISFAWPFGVYTEAAVSMINKGGFTTSVMVNPDSLNNNSSDPMRLRRLTVDGNFSAETVLQMVTSGKAPK